MDLIDNFGRLLTVLSDFEVAVPNELLGTLMSKISRNKA